MLTPDEKQFEAYLKRFRPLVPESLQMKTHAKVTRRASVLAWWTAAAAVTLLAAAISVYVRMDRTRSARTIERVVPAGRLVGAQPLTIRSANAYLASSSSFKAAIDELAFRQGTPLPKDKHSALAVLSEEKSKL